MKNLTRASALSSCILLLALGATAKADQWDEKTVMTISEPLQVPNKLLQPGTYVLKLEDSQSDRHIVRIFNKDETHLITTVLAIPNYRLTPTGKTRFAFWETPAGQPRALRAWFYPGDNFGQEFAYPKTMTTTIASSNSNAVVPEEPAPVVAEAPAPAPRPEAQPEPAPAPTVAAAEPPPAPEPAPAPQQINAPAPQELPTTASDYPLIGLIGLFSLLAFGMLTIRARRAA